MIPLLHFIAWLIGLYMDLVIIAVVVSWLIAFGVINRYNQYVSMIVRALDRLIEPAMRPIRNALPDLGGLDISPIVLIILLIFLRDVVILGWLTPSQHGGAPGQPGYAF
jgi:YggT family protein